MSVTRETTIEQAADQVVHVLLQPAVSVERIDHPRQHRHVKRTVAGAIKSVNRRHRMGLLFELPDRRRRHFLVQPQRLAGRTLAAELGRAHQPGLPQSLAQRRIVRDTLERAAPFADVRGAGRQQDASVADDFATAAPP